jgi:hypothetical protein
VDRGVFTGRHTVGETRGFVSAFQRRPDQWGLFAVGFCAMSRHVRNAGAFYAYITRGLGGVIGSGSALVAYVAYALGEIGFCAAAGLFASVALDSLVGSTVSWGSSIRW